MSDFDDKNIIPPVPEQERIHDDSGSDSLQSYLRSIGSIEQLSPDAITDLTAELEKAGAAFRRAVYAFGFAMEEYLRLLNAAKDNADARSDDFLLSSYNLFQGETAAEKRRELERFAIDVAGKISAFQSAFQSDSPLADEKRADAVESMTTLELSGDAVEELYHVLLDYISPNGGASDDILVRVRTENLSATQREFLNGKFAIKIDRLGEHLRIVRAAREKLEELRRKMLESNLRLVISVAQKFRNRGVPFNDLIQEGNLGLIRALEKFDFKLGHRFTTYAIWWIRQNISRTLAEQSRVIRIPAHMVNTINNMNKIEQRFLQEFGREPEIEEFAKIMEVPVERISAIRKMARQTISLQSPIGTAGDNSVLEDVIPDEISRDPRHDFAQRILFTRIREMLSTLPEREQQIIIMRFGLFGHTPMSPTEVSVHFNLTRERIRQIEMRILEKLRSPECLKLIDNCRHEDGSI